MTRAAIAGRSDNRTGAAIRPQGQYAPGATAQVDGVSAGSGAEGPTSVHTGALTQRVGPGDRHNSTDQELRALANHAEQRAGVSVAALYVSGTGPYASDPRCDPLTVERDAKRYAGPWPVVAHPPCGPWGRLRFMCRLQDPDCGPRAVEQVRAFGGVLEHPADSLLFKRCRLPFPGELPDEFGGRTYAVRQVAWGHACEKPTWLYVVRADHRWLVANLRTGGTATHRVTSGPRGKRLPSASAAKRIKTPPAFADFLIAIAQSVRTRTA